MTLYPFYDVIRDVNGVAVPNATVVANNPLTGTAAQIYDKAGNAVVQPISTDASGSIVNGAAGDDGIGFWAPAGRYELVVTSSDQTAKLPEIHLGPLITRLASGTDLDTVTWPGPHDVNSPVNSPDGASSSRWWFVEIVKASVTSGSVVQRAVPADTDEVWHRSQKAGVWGSWVQLAYLDANGLLPTSILPPISLTDVNVVASETEQLDLTAQEGDVAIRTDVTETYLHNGGTAGTMADWTKIQTFQLNYFTEAKDVTTGVNGTVPVHSWGAIGAETDIDIALVPKGAGAITAQVADGTAAGGDKRGTYAVDLQANRQNNTEVASGNSSVIAGGQLNTASGQLSAVLGGYGNEATGDGSTAMGYSNTSSGTHSFTSGYGNTASAHYSVALSQSNVASNYNCVAWGRQNSASGQWATAAGGYQNEATGAWSITLGGWGATTRGLKGVAARSSGYFSAVGDAQTENLVLRIETADATPTIATADGGVEGLFNVAVMPDNHMYGVVAHVTARNTSTGDAKVWKIEGAAKQGVGAATVALVGTPTKTVVAADTGASAWDCNLVVNTIRGSVEVEVVGEAAKTIHWVCKFDTVEVS